MRAGKEYVFAYLLIYSPVYLFTHMYIYIYIYMVPFCLSLSPPSAPSTIQCARNVLALEDDGCGDSSRSEHVLGHTHTHLTLVYREK